jgi:hypothetical protein
MKSTNHYFLKIVIALSIINTQSPIWAKENSSIQIRAIENTGNIAAPGCRYWSIGTNQKVILNTWAMSSGGALINIDSRDTELKPIVRWKSYILGNLKVQIKTKSFRTTDPEVNERGSIIISKGNKSRIIKVEGACGD